MFARQDLRCGNSIYDQRKQLSWETLRNDISLSRGSCFDSKNKILKEGASSCIGDFYPTRIGHFYATVGGDFCPTLTSVDALKDLAGSEMKINMAMYGGFEQVGSIGTSLPRNDSQMTTSPGDIVLYSGNQIVIFYGSNSWAYTRLGKITGLNEKELEDTFGNGDVTIGLSVGGQTD